MRATLAALIVVAGTLGAGRDLEAQARATIVPAIAVGSVFDDNLFTQQVGTADVMNQLTPSLEADWDSPNQTLLSLFSVDMQRSIGHSVLNTFDARRHAFVDARLHGSPESTFSITANYDRSETPGELNLETAILSDRQQASRWQVTPGFDYRFNPRTTFTMQYSGARETLSEPVQDITSVVHVGRAGVSRQLSERDTLTVGYLGRFFVDGPDRYQSGAALVGWTHELAPFTSVTLQAGPRVSSYAGLSTEIVAEFARKTDRLKTGIDYWHGESIVLGILGPVAVHSATASLAVPVRRQLEVGTHVGVFDSTTLERAEARVYNASLVAAWSPGGPYTVAASYGIDFQKGDVRSSLLSEKTVFRNVFLIRMTIAPRINHSFLPPDEAARAKGVSR